MTKKIRYCLLIIAAAVCLSCLCIAGCKIGDLTREEVLQDYKANVVYYGNGGYFNEFPDEKVSNVYFKNDPSSQGYNPDGVPFFEVTEDTKGMGLKIERRGYDFMGWYMPKTDTNGEVMYTYIPEGQTEKVAVYPVKDENGNPVHDFKTDRPVFARAGIDEQIPESSVYVEASEQRVTSTYLLADDAKLIVCAVWRPSLKVQYILVCDEDLVVDEVTYKNGDVISEVNFGKDNTYIVSTVEPRSIKNATFLRTYSNADCSETVTSVSRPEDEVLEDGSLKPVKLYSRYIKGDWTVITNSASSVRALFSGLNDKTKNFYVMENVTNSVTVQLKNADRYTSLAHIEGNGFTIKNITFNLGTLTADNGAVFSPFGTLGESFEMNNLNFENITVQIKGKGDLTIHGFASACHQSATLNGVSISDVSITADVPTGRKVTNYDEEQTNVLFGGVADDAAFLAAHSGVTVSGVNTLTLDKV